MATSAVATCRVTYHVFDRVFDRIFREESLPDMKAVVRRKLGLEEEVEVRLSQMRDGHDVDLEDDEDFESFRVTALYAPRIDVRVKLVDQDGERRPRSISAYPSPETSGFAHAIPIHREQQKRPASPDLHPPPAKKRRAAKKDVEIVPAGPVAAPAATTTEATNEAGPSKPSKPPAKRANARTAPPASTTLPSAAPTTSTATITSAAPAAVGDSPVRTSLAVSPPTEDDIIARYQAGLAAKEAQRKQKEAEKEAKRLAKEKARQEKEETKKAGGAKTKTAKKAADATNGRHPAGTPESEE